MLLANPPVRPPMPTSERPGPSMVRSLAGRQGRVRARGNLAEAGGREHVATLGR